MNDVYAVAAVAKVLSYRSLLVLGRNHKKDIEVDKDLAVVQFFYQVAQKYSTEGME